MKLAKLNDLRKALESRNLGTVPCIRRLAFSGLPGFADASIEPKASFLAICGGTGVGKTALLELLYSALSSLPEKYPERPVARLGSAQVQLGVTVPDGGYQRNLDLGNLEDEWEGYGPEVQIVGLGERASELQRLFSSQDVAVLKEGVASAELNQETRELVSMICRKNFSRVTVFETETENDLIAPFFEVETPTSNYDSRTMASGELSVLYLAWAMNRAQPLSMVLIEEPEAYLPPVSHAGIFGLICAATVKRRLGLIITTHSAEIASHVPQGNLLSIRTQSGESRIPVTAESKQRVLSRLGLAPQKAAVLFVEDEVAKIVLEECLGIYEFAVSTSIEIVISHGAGGVKSALEGLPDGIASFSFLGVLDGDMRTEAEAWGLDELIVFLPFSNAMETEFIEAINARTNTFAQLINRSAEQIEEQLNSSNGAEAHDRFTQLAAGLGVSHDTLSRCSFAHWLKGPGKRSAAKRFASTLAVKLGVSLP